VPELHWLGDTDAKREARRVPYRLLEPVEQVGDTSAQNLLIQGDNLEALKALLPFYAGRVKCIFIDPPYNTKSAFEHYDDNLEHSQWLSMMYPRLELLRDLLSEDGSIWVTIDDNEAHYLKVMMDEVFGRKNFVLNVLWQKRTSADARLDIGDAHDHLLLYSRSRERFSLNRIQLTTAQAAQFKNPDNDPNGAWASTDYTAQGWRPRQMYTITTPSGATFTPPDGRCWANIEPEFNRLLSEGRMWFGKDGDSRPRVKSYLAEHEGVRAWSWWTNAEVGHNQEAKKEINELFGANSAFDTPKPERLIQRVLSLATKTGDIVLDSYLGSGTTASVAHKMGRRYIGIEMGEHAVTHCLPRLKKVVDGEQGGISEAVGWKGGGGFRFMKLGEPVFLDDGRINAAVRFATLASYLWFLEAGTPHATNIFDTPLLGTMGGEQKEDGTSSPRTAIILLYNGILGDKRPQAGNVLTTPIWNGILAQLPPHNGPRIIYGEACRLSAPRQKQLGVTFKQIPYDIRMR
jgi:adenine-specific DNA-methyltransferase